MDQYQQYIHKSRYARWVDKENRRETWEESVQRYIDYFTAKCPDMAPLMPELRDAILNLEIMPSMRALMTAGKALERDHIAGYNPVSGTTRVVTRERGNTPIQELAGGTYTVLNKDGKWVSASFRSYGIQPLHRVTVRLNSNTVKQIDCTENHRWVLSSGKVVSTASLTSGDRIAFVSAPKAEIDADYRRGVQHGLIYGDGTATKAGERVRGYHIRLCGKNAEQLSWFSEYPVCYPPSAGGDPVVQMYDGFAATHSLKHLPSPSETESYLLGFIRGWLAADGSVTTAGSQVTLCASELGVRWLQDFSEKLGFVIQHVRKQPAETNYGKRNAGSYIVSFSRSSISEDDLLCSWKREAFRPLESHFVVKSVEALGVSDEVFCAEVPETNTFVLEGGLLTGNCSFVAVDDPRAFDETLYVLACGTGVGFSVERQFVNCLPVVSETFHPSDTCIVVPDSKVGWASSFKQLVSLLYSGEIPTWDMSKVRPAGARLKTFGGRASGPEPLDNLFKFTVALFQKAAGRKLTSIECHDLMCSIADTIVVGGVRRSALISLSNLSDDRMRNAKAGQWWETHGFRELANNSVAYTEKPEIGAFMAEWHSLYESKSGERGIVNRVAAKKAAIATGRRDPNYDFGVNPCSEIFLRPSGLCNLTEVVIRPTDNINSLLRKVRLATILGTLQATLTDFRYLRPVWKKNAEEERLLGVSLTGIMDHPVMNGSMGKEMLEDTLNKMRNAAIVVNAKCARQLGINPAAAITTVKPSGTVSQLVNSSSGIHPRYSPYYIRTVRGDKKDPLSQMIFMEGVPAEDEARRPNDMWVFSFPIKSPDTAVFRNDRSAIEQLELYLAYKSWWAEHNVSITCYVKEHEWLEVGAWVYKNWDLVGGVSFLPHDEGTTVYKQAPYQEIDEATYLKAKAAMPEINWDRLKNFEHEDATTGTQELACVGGACEIT